MKTLDEVIDIMEHPLYGADDGFAEMAEDDIADALHYLREYRNCGDCAYADSYLRCTQESRNDPLDWETLKQMEGKPVWFEVMDPKALPALDSGWGIVGCTSFTTWEGVESFSLVKVGVTYAVPIAQYERAWNVYRKERS